MGRMITFSAVLFIAQVSQDINLGPLAGLIGSLGSAGAAVIVVIYFLAYVRDQGKIIDNMKNNQVEMQRNYQNSLEDITRRFAERQEDLQDFFEKQLQRVTSGQNEILRETIITVKSFEKSLESIKSEIQALVLVKIKPNEQLELKSDNLQIVKKDD